MNELDKSLAKLVDATQKLAPDLVQAKAVEGYISVAVCAVFAIFGTVLCAKIYRYWKKTPEISDSIGVLMIIGVVASAFAIGSSICFLPEAVATALNPAYYAIKGLVH